MHVIINANIDWIKWLHLVKTTIHNCVIE